MLNAAIIAKTSNPMAKLTNLSFFFLAISKHKATEMVIGNKKSVQIMVSAPSKKIGMSSK